MKAYRFAHLNVRSHYSINDGCASIGELVDAAIKERMPGIAITDNGNMFGIMIPHYPIEFMFTMYHNIKEYSDDE
jgi:DNA polymerase III alpha subunit